MELQGSRTEANLMAAFAGESQARNKYTFYAAKARENGFRALAEVFQETAENERAHAEIWFTLLHNGAIPDSEPNLQDAAGGEHFEWNEMYPDFARQAREEGFNHIAYLFEQVAKIEQAHENRYLKWADELKNGLVFSKEGDTVWRCANCGHVFVGKEAPAVCPVCSHPQSYFYAVSNINAPTGA